MISPAPIGTAVAERSQPRILARLGMLVDRFTVVASSLLLVAIVATMFVGVIYRYVLNSALPWTEELAGLAMGWMVFLGSVVLYRRGGHPAIEMLAARLPHRAQPAVAAARFTVVGVYLVALAVAGARLIATSQPHTPALAISYSYLYAAIPAAAVLTLVHWLSDVAEGLEPTARWSVVALVAIAGVGLAWVGPLAAQGFSPMILWLLLPLLFAIGVPIAIVLGATSIALLFAGGTPLTILVQRLYSGIDNPSFLAIPAFMLTGALMGATGMSEALIRFTSSLVGRVRGGLAQADVLASVLFADMSGSSVADTAAIGSVMMPGMLARGYDEGFVVAHQAASGSLGTLFPPSISMIIFATVTSASVTQLFLGTLIPGCLVAATYMLIAYLTARRRGYPREEPIGMRALLGVTGRAIPALVAPIVVLGGILGGVFTPYEAGAVAAVYAFVVGALSHMRRPTAAYASALLAGVQTASMVLFIIANASIIAWVMIGQQIPQTAAQFVASTSQSPLVILLLISALLIVLGIFLEPPAILIAVVPIALPIVQNLHVSPVHFGVIVMLTTAIGMLLPPIGITLLVSASILKVPIERAARSVVPYVLATAADLVIVILLPQIATWLPTLANH